MLESFYRFCLRSYGEILIVLVYFLHVFTDLSIAAPSPCLSSSALAPAPAQSPSPSPSPSFDFGQSNFNVIHYGAIGDGKHDDAQAFTKAWNDVCGAVVTNNIPTLIVPDEKTFLLSPISFSGSCKSHSIHVQIQGKIVAPSNRTAWKNCTGSWLHFRYIDNLLVDGSGEIDGQGSFWWTSKHTDAGPCDRPQALTFSSCNGLQLHGLALVNSPRSHLSINGCNNSIIANIRIVAPANSPNTDGIDIDKSNHVQIRDSSIASGDDCIAIGTGTSWINITGVTCGPGHGISVGSLGKDGENAKVEQILVKNCTFNGSTNGARIKTWQGGLGYARNITFDNITLINVENPIIIDQFYCANSHCEPMKTAVAISGVTYRGFRGTSATEVAICLNCSSIVPCTAILMEKIDITSLGPKNKTLSAMCNNAQGIQDSVTPKVPCLH